jgi:hypothetical protein
MSGGTEYALMRMARESPFVVDTTDQSCPTK